MGAGDEFDAEDVWQFPESLLIHYLMRAKAGESDATHIDGDEL